VYRHSRVQRDARLRQQDEALIARLLQRDPQQQLQRDGEVCGAPAALRGTYGTWRFQKSIFTVFENTLIEGELLGCSRLVVSGLQIKDTVGRLHRVHSVGNLMLHGLTAHETLGCKIAQ